MFRSRLRVRHTAALMLLAWLFALAASVAQACVTPMPPSPHGEHCALATAHDGTAAPGDTGNTAWKAVCAKFCSDTALPSAKANPSFDTPADTQPVGLPVLLVALAFDAEPADHPSQGPPFADAALPRPPIPIVFLRLAL